MKEIKLEIKHMIKTINLLMDNNPVLINQELNYDFLNKNYIFLIFFKRLNLEKIEIANLYSCLCHSNPIPTLSMRQDNFFLQLFLPPSCSHFFPPKDGVSLQKFHTKQLKYHFLLYVQDEFQLHKFYYYIL